MHELVVKHNLVKYDFVYKTHLLSDILGTKFYKILERNLRFQFDWFIRLFPYLYKNVPVKTQFNYVNLIL